MSNEYMWQNIFNKNKDTEIHNILKKVPLFEGLSEKQLQKVIKYTHLREYNAGETIFKEKDLGLGVYIIKSGRINIHTTAHLMEKESTLAELKQGEFFGELALLDEIHRSATANAIEQLELLAFFRPDLLLISNNDPYLGNKLLMNIAKVLAERLRMTNKKLQKVK